MRRLGYRWREGELAGAWFYWLAVAALAGLYVVAIGLSAKAIF